MNDLTPLEKQRIKEGEKLGITPDAVLWLLDLIELEVQRRTSGGNSQVVKPEESTTTPTPETGITGTFNLAFVLGEVSAAQDILTNIHTRLSAVSPLSSSKEVGGDSGPIVQESSDSDKLGFVRSSEEYTEYVSRNEGYDPNTCTHPSINRRSDFVDGFRRTWCGLCGKVKSGK